MSPMQARHFTNNMRLERRTRTTIIRIAYSVVQPLTRPALYTGLLSYFKTCIVRAYQILQKK